MVLVANLIEVVFIDNIHTDSLHNYSIRLVDSLHAVTVVIENYLNFLSSRVDFI